MKKPFFVFLVVPVLLLAAAPASAQSIVFLELEADLEVWTDDVGQSFVSLLSNREAYGSEGDTGIAAGSVLIIPDGSDVMGVEPSPFRWEVDLSEAARIPPDGTRIVSFQLDDSGNVMGVEPSPFSPFVVFQDLGGGGDDEPVSLGRIDFTSASGRVGSLHLEGLQLVDRPDGAPDLVIEPVHIGVIHVEIDIKPGSEPNSINLGSAGVIPVAILSSSTFDATTVDPETVTLAGASVRVVGRGQRLLAHAEDVNGDGLDDLVCQVETEETLIEVGDSLAELVATTVDGDEVRGYDSIRIVSE